MISKTLPKPQQKSLSNQEILQLLQTNHQVLFDKALSFTKNIHDAEDLLQELSFKVFKRKDAFQPGTNFYAWSMTLLKNLFINGYRRKKRFISKSKDFIKIEYWGASSCENNGELNLEYQDVIDLVEDLGEQYKTPIMMYYKGYTYEEISQKLELPLGTTKSRIFIARKKLKEQINPINSLR